MYNFFWHGSTMLISDDFLLPGRVLGKPSRYGLDDRNQQVWVAVGAKLAADMGRPQWRDDEHPRLMHSHSDCRIAPFLYAVEPHKVFKNKAPHNRVLGEEAEMACDYALILARYQLKEEHKGALRWALREPTVLDLYESI